MAKTKTTKTPKGNRNVPGRPKPLVHPPGLTRTRRRYGCGGALKKKSS
jgi:hypothetical protein